MENSKRFFLLRWTWWLKLFCVFSLVGLLLGYLSPFIHPVTFWPVAFFGLTYPVFLFLSLFCLLVFAIKKSKWTLFILAVLLIGGKLHLRHFVTGFGKAESLTQKSSSIKVLSYNVHLFDYYNSDNQKGFYNRDKIFQFLREEQPEIACFQEFYSQDAPSKFITKDSIYEILSAQSFHQRAATTVYKRQNFGVTIYSKHPVIAKGEVSFGNGSNNYCIFIDVVKDRDTFRVYNAHLQSIYLTNVEMDLVSNANSDFDHRKSGLARVVQKLKTAFPIRVAQAERILEHAAQSPYSTIICGDFNDSPMSYTYNLFDEKYTDAFRNSSLGFGWTYAGRLPAGRIDYIFHTPDLNSVNFSIQENAFSDHYAILVEVEKGE